VLAKALRGAPSQQILDVGAGTGRDAAAMAVLGHTVTAVEPSEQMRRLARALHPQAHVTWIKDALPNLTTLNGRTGQFDLVVVSAIWMHIHPGDREAAMERLADLTKPGGEIYLTLRLAPSEPARSVYAVPEDEVNRLAGALGLTVAGAGEQPDLLGRPNIRWRTVRLSKPST
jgi:2-polyprenyl-3-methyl-5-hydroxy-6-metoxy-1,4-benzoquinol methylase